MIGRAHIAAEAIRHRALLEAALDVEGSGLYTFRDVVDYLLAGRVHLWTDTKAAVVTCIHEMPRGKSCTIWLAGGDLDQCLAIEERIAEYAREQGCKVIEIHGRSGWVRVLRARGYGPAKVSLCRNIDSAAAAEPLPRDQVTALVEPAAAAPTTEEA
jgi:hypothetical protein